MAERRKIIITTGADTDEPLSTPHFDAEATMTARPVVPLADQETYQAHDGDYAVRAAKPFWKRPALLVLIVLIAVGVGVAAGLAIGIYRSRQGAETPVATVPSSTVEETGSGQTIESPDPAPAPQARATVAEKPEEEPTIEPEDEERERTARNERTDDDDDEVSQPVAVKPPVAREKKPIKVDEYIIEDEREERQAEKARRREERRERRRRQREANPNIPREIERAGRELDRIREIFEGRQP